MAKRKRKIVLSAVLCLILASAVFAMTKALLSPNKKYPQTSAVQSTKPITTSIEKPLVKATNVSKIKSTPYIMLDPGHGGIDYGTVSGKVFEKTINLDIANRLKSCLIKNGYKVLMTRNKDVLLADKSNILGTLEKKDLDARTKLLNSSNASLFISLHVDSDPSQPKRNGSIVYYNTFISGSEKLAAVLQSELNKVTLNGKKRVSNLSSSADFYILKNADIPGVLVEAGFITNNVEKECFMQEKFRADIANAIYNGIYKYNQNSMYLTNVKKESVRVN
jgi:N-acetylmuramoyl-L-alanine amidase